MHATVVFVGVYARADSFSNIASIQKQELKETIPQSLRDTESEAKMKIKKRAIVIDSIESFACKCGACGCGCDCSIFYSKATLEDIAKVGTNDYSISAGYRK